MKTEREDSQLVAWLQGLGKEPLDLWRETMTNLRQLHSDVWNGVRFFLTVNGILLAGVAGLVKLDTYSNGTALMVVLLGVLGLAVTLVARRILKGHRDYYTEMLLRKTLIEYDLGFYFRELSGIDLSFPWKVPKKFLPDLLANPEKWLADQKQRKGTISHLLFRVYDVTILLWVLVLTAAFVELFNTMRSTRLLLSVG